MNMTARSRWQSSSLMARRLLAWRLVTPVAARWASSSPTLSPIASPEPLLARSTATSSTGRRYSRSSRPSASSGRVQERSLGRRSPWAFALVAPLGFVAQEHVERLAHMGELPWLSTTLMFLLGLALQVPIALLCVLAVPTARRVADRRAPGPVARARRGMAAAERAATVASPRRAPRSPDGPWAAAPPRVLASTRPFACHPTPRRDHMKIIGTLLAVAASAFALAGCGGDDTTRPHPRRTRPPSRR